MTKSGYSFETTLVVPNCEHCDLPETFSALKKCGRCLLTRYCSRSCQKDDWQTHKQNCVLHEEVDSTKHKKLINLPRVVRKLTRTWQSMSTLAQNRGFVIWSDDALFCDKLSHLSDESDWKDEHPMKVWISHDPEAGIYADMNRLIDEMGFRPEWFASVESSRFEDEACFVLKADVNASPQFIRCLPNTDF